MLAQVVFTTSIALVLGFNPILGRAEYDLKANTVTRQAFGSGQRSVGGGEDVSEDSSEDNVEEDNEDDSADDSQSAE